MKPISIILLALTFASTLHAADVVDNLANASVSQIVLDGSNFEAAAQAFTSGPDLSTLGTVTVRLRHFQGANSSARVQLWKGDGNLPETLVEDLGVITGIVSINDFEYLIDPTGTVILEPNQRYWIAVRHESGDFDWRNTSSGTIAGTSTGTLPEFRATSSDGTTWNTFSTGNFQFVSVESVPPLVVTRLADDNDPGSLRKSIADAPSNSLIVFDPNLPTGSIVLDGNSLDIAKNLIIDASSVPGGVTIDGDDRSRVFTVDAANTVLMKNLTITGGRAPDGVNSSGGDGGGIFTFGTLTLQECTISNNRAGHADGSHAGGDGGGIFNTGTLTLLACTVTENRGGTGRTIGGFGGGILSNLGEVTLRQCTVSGNQAGAGTQSGVGGFGGGIYNNGGTLLLEQSTVSANRAGDAGDNAAGQGGSGGGISNNSGMLTVRQCTVFGNHGGGGGTGGNGGSGGGIAGAAVTFTLADSIVAGNAVGPGNGGGSDGKGPDFETDSNTILAGVNLIGDNTLDTGAASTVFNVGLFGTGGNPLDPLLGPLADNGGPTLTHLPLDGSPAIDPPNGATESPDLPTDQRGEGFPRIVTDIQDIGAVEAPDYDAVDDGGGPVVGGGAVTIAASAAQQADFSKKLKKLKKKFKNAKRKGQASKAKKLKKQIKSLTKQMRAL